MGEGLTLTWPSAEATSFIALFLLAHIIPYLDTLDFAVRLYLRRLHSAGASESSFRCSVVIEEDAATGSPPIDPSPYAIIVSVYNIASDLSRFLDGVGDHRKRLWVMDDGSSDRTYQHLTREGLEVRRTPTNCKKPAALRALLKELPPEVVTVVVVDPDVAFGDGVRPESADLDAAVRRFQRSGRAALCPRIAVEEEGVLSALQSLEYDLAMCLGRRSLGDSSTTSGVALYRRDALESLLEEHSLSVYAEDLENTFLLLSRGERIYYDGGLVIRARCPSDWRHWFSQRVGWYYGLLRVFASRWRALCRRPMTAACFYHYFVYVGMLTVLLHPLRVAGVFVLAASFTLGVARVLGLGLVPEGVWFSSYYFALAYFQYTLLVSLAVRFAVDPGSRSRHIRVLPVYFLYALLQVVPATVGFLNWLSVKLFRRRLYRDHYEPELEASLALPARRAA